MAIEDIVAQDKADRARADKLLADDKGLGQAPGLGLNGVLDGDAPLRAIAQQPLELAIVFRRRDD